MEGIKVCQKAGCRIGKGIATMGRQNLETRWVEKLACFYLDVQKTVPVPIRA